MRWQMALYKETSGKAEDADAPEKVVKRVQEVSAVLFHIELVRPVSTYTSYTLIFLNVKPFLLILLLCLPSD